MAEALGLGRSREGRGILIMCDHVVMKRLNISDTTGVKSSHVIMHEYWCSCLD